MCVVFSDLVARYPEQVCLGRPSTASVTVAPFIAAAERPDGTRARIPFGLLKIVLTTFSNKAKDAVTPQYHVRE